MTLSVKLFADTANLGQMREISDRVAGWTTNPSLMKAAGVSNYGWFANECVETFPEHPISFEVVADDLATIRTQARTISLWGQNVYVKIPVSLRDGTSTLDLVRYLSHDGVKINVTAVFTSKQVYQTCEILANSPIPSYISVFAGRIADTGVDPCPHVRTAVVCKGPNTEVIWASTREVYNIRQAEEVHCDIVTIAPEMLSKIGTFGKDLDSYSLETIGQFHRDAQLAGLTV